MRIATLSSPIEPRAREKGPVGKAIAWLDAYSSPRQDTAGNLPEASFFQAAFNGGADGLYMFGPVGIVSGAGSASAGIAVQRWTQSQTLGVAAGAVVGGAMGAGICHFITHTNVLPGIVGGTLLGAFETLRGDPCAKRRDASNLFSSVFLKGPAKLAGSFGAMVGAHCDSVWLQSATAAAVGAATGAAVAALLPGGPSIRTAAIISGLGAGIGPVAGARTSQFLRNLSLDIGKGMKKMVGHSSDSADKPQQSSKVAQVLGSIPVSFAREGMRAFLMSDGNWSAVLVGGVKESLRQCHVALAAKPETSGESKPVEAAHKLGLPKDTDEVHK